MICQVCLHHLKAIAIATVFFISGIVFIGRASGQDMYDKHHTTLFADHLFAAKEYKMAANEYQRLARLSGLNDSLIQKIMLCYRLGGMADSGLAFYSKPHILSTKFIGKPQA